MRLPTNGAGIVLRNDRPWLRGKGYLYAEGTRNTFDLAFTPDGDLLGTENGPTSDASEELNWLRRNRHYGFPWRFGGIDNPQQYPDYDPSRDTLLNPLYDAVQDGYWHNDPDFPKPPVVAMVEAARNYGPDADKFRDASTGAILDASARKTKVRTFTSHRSPLGLSFDRANAMAPEFRGHAFMVSWTAGDPDGDQTTGPFMDAGQDLLHLVLTKPDGNYKVQAMRIASDFNNPIDTEIIGKTIYVLDYGGTGAIWEVTMP